MMRIEHRGEKVILLDRCDNAPPVCFTLAEVERLLSSQLRMAYLKALENSPAYRVLKMSELRGELDRLGRLESETKCNAQCDR